MPSLASLVRYARTARYLRPVQIYGRVWFRLHRPKPDLRPAPSMLGARTFRFLNETRELPATGGWDDPAAARLWRYNLHYFDDVLVLAIIGGVVWMVVRHRRRRRREGVAPV